jgi:branched-chain amino acid transport system ATP-binding protein
MAEAALRLEEVSKLFGAVRAVDGVSLQVAPGSLACLIGPNGAGKSTLLQCIAGSLEQDEGRILLGGSDVSTWPAHRRSRLGLGTVFQIMRPPLDLDVLTAVMVGCHAWTRTGFVEGILRPPWQWREERAIREEALRALELVGLDGRASDPTGSLPLGQLRLIAVARVLAQRPSVLLLDEPAAGLRAAEKGRLAGIFRDLAARGLTQIVVEHDMQFVGSVAERVIVLDRGRLIADGPPTAIRADERVVAAYLGTTTL